jgi:hypothetical protein
MSHRNTRRISRGREIIDPASLPLHTGHEQFDAEVRKYLTEIETRTQAEAAVAKAVTHVAEVREEWPRMLHRAKIAGQRTPKDPLPAAEADIEVKQVALEVGDEAVLATGDPDDGTLAAIRTSASFQEHCKLERDKAMAHAKEWVEQGKDLLADLDAARRAHVWAQAGYAKSVAGRYHDPLLKIEQEIEALESGRETVFVTPLAYSQLQAGQDVEDTKGRKLTWVEADALKRVGRLRVAYGKPRFGGIPS